MRTLFYKYNYQIRLAILLILGTTLFPNISLSTVSIIVPNYRGLQDVDSNYVYFRQGIGAEFCAPPGGVLRAPITGGWIETLYEDCDFSPYYVGIDGPHAYILDWDSDAVVKMPITGGTPIKIADASGAVFHRGFSLDSNFVYWGDNGGVKRAYKTGIGTITLASRDPSLDGVNSITNDDTYVYYLEGKFDSYELKRVPKIGGTSQVLYSSFAHCQIAGGLSVDSTHLYWIEGLCDQPNVMRKMVKNGSSPPATLFNPGVTRYLSGTKLRSNLVFFIEHEFPSSVVETTGKIRYIPKVGGAANDLVTGLTLPGGLLTDERYVYWSDDNGRVGGITGIKREDLPPLDNDGDGYNSTVDCDDNNPDVTVGNTCVSESPVTVESDSGEVTVTFPEITGGGTTTITTEECTPSDVEGITLVPTAPLCADIETDASFEVPVKVCIYYDDTGLTLVQEAYLTMVRCEAGSCEALACEPPEPVDTVNNIVCGCTDGFSTFAVGTLIDTDGDFTPDLLDNCPYDINWFQEDIDGDGIGDICDNCPSVWDPTNHCAACVWDFNQDQDVDGLDWALFVAGYGTSYTSTDLADIAEEFGRVNCF